MYKQEVQKLLAHERLVLQTLEFDLQVTHPFKTLIKFGRELEGSKIS